MKKSMESMTSTRESTTDPQLKRAFASQRYVGWEGCRQQRACRCCQQTECIALVLAPMVEAADSHTRGSLHMYALWPCAKGLPNCKDL